MSTEAASTEPSALERWPLNYAAPLIWAITWRTILIMIPIFLIFFVFVGTMLAGFLGLLLPELGVAALYVTLIPMVLAMLGIEYLALSFATGMAARKTFSAFDLKTVCSDGSVLDEFPDRFSPSVAWLITWRGFVLSNGITLLLAFAGLADYPLRSMNVELGGPAYVAIPVYLLVIWSALVKKYPDFQLIAEPKPANISVQEES